MNISGDQLDLALRRLIGMRVPLESCQTTLTLKVKAG